MRIVRIAARKRDLYEKEMDRLGLLFPTLCFASARDLVKYVPSDSFTVIGADFSTLRSNEIFLSLEQKGKVWDSEGDSDLTHSFKILNIDPRADVKTFLFSKYMNSYGSKGDLRIFELNRDISFSSEGSIKYLNLEILRLEPEEDVYAAVLSPRLIAFGTLNEAKMAVDLAQGKTPSLAQNPRLYALLDKVPGPSAVWGVAVPRSNKQSSAKKGNAERVRCWKPSETTIFMEFPAGRAWMLISMAKP